MGKSRVKGIVIQLGGDTTGLDKALQGVNKRTSETQKQLRDVERLLKLDPKNTVLLEQKHKLLAQAIQETKEKQEALNQANDQVKASVKNYDDWKKAYDPIKAEIDATTKKLRDLKQQQKELEDCGEVDTEAYKQLTQEVQEASRELKELKAQAKAVGDQFGNPVSPEQFDSLQREIIETRSELQRLEDKAVANFRSIDRAVDSTQDRMEALGRTAATVKDKAAGVADAFQPATNAVVGLAGAAAATVPATAELREDLSRLDANAKENAVSAEAARKAWKEFAAQSGEPDSAVEAVSNLLQAGFTESNLQKAVEGLAGAAQRFPDTLKVESLADSLQETLATGAATGQFAELLERLGLNLEDFNGKMALCTTAAERQELVLSTLASQGLADSYNAWKKNNAEMVKNKEASLNMELAMAELAEVVLPFVTRGTEQVAKFVEGFARLPGPVQGAIAALLLLVASIGPVAGGISNAAGVVELFASGKIPTMTNALGFLTGTVLPGVQGAFSAVFGFIAANPVVLLIGAIVGLVALIAAKGDETLEILDMVDSFLQSVFAVDWTEVFGPILGGVLNEFFDNVKAVWDGVKQILEGIVNFIAGVFSGDWERAWNGVKQIFSGIFDSLEGLLKAPINGVIRMVNAAIDGINWLIEGVNRVPGVDIGTIGQIPMLANGGEVLRGSAIVGDGGPELLTVLGDRTVVQPLTNNSYSSVRNLGGAVFNVYGAPGQSPRELAREMSEELQRLYEDEEAGL